RLTSLPWTTIKQSLFQTLSSIQIKRKSFFEKKKTINRYQKKRFFLSRNLFSKNLFPFLFFFLSSFRFQMIIIKSSTKKKEIICVSFVKEFPHHRPSENYF